jgi:hypothetical protein
MTSAAAGAEPARPAPALAPWVAAVLAAAFLLAIYLAPFLRDPSRVPPGLDTPGYVWRAGAVYERGLDALPSFRDRPGHPVLVSVLLDVTRATPLDLARVWPAVIAAAIGLAAVALAGIGLREGPWVRAALAVSVAGSAFIVVTAIGYAANLLVDLFVVAALALALHVRSGGRGLVAIGVLVVAAAATHWLFAVLLLGLLSVVAVAALVWPAPDSDEDAGRPGRRLVVAIAVAAILGGLSLLLAPSLPSEIVAQTFQGDVDRRIEKRLPPLAVTVTLPLAAAGAIAVATLGDARRRRTLPALVAWAAIAPAGLVAWYVLHLRFPPYRTAAVALGVPALIVLGAAVPASASFERGRRAAAIVAATLAIGTTGWLVGVGTATWWRAEPAVGRADLAQATTLDAYLRRLPPGTMVVVPLPLEGVRPPRILRLGMEAAHADAVALVPADLSAGTEAFVDEILDRYPDGTVVVFLDTYRRPDPGTGETLGPGVTLVHGPRPDGALAPPSIGTDVGELVRATALAFGLLVVTGLGWVLALTRLRVVDAVGLAPAVGAAALVIAGLVAGRLGLSYAGGGGIAIAIVAAVGGWVAWAIRRSLTIRAGVEPSKP